MELNLWQSEDWKRFQERLGFKTERVVDHSGSALVVKRDLPFGFIYYYCPRGPVVQGEDSLDGLMLKLSESAATDRAIFTRLDPLKALKVDHVGLIVKSDSHQPRATLLLNLSLSEDELLAQMKQKGRYNIKLAQKKGVQIVTVDKSDLRQFEDSVKRFCELLKKTTERDGFSSHNEAYYRVMLEEVRVSELMLAYKNDRVIAGGIFCFDRDFATYYYGASDHDERHVMAPYLLQWVAIREAKRRRCKKYDFLGVSDDSAPEKKWEGITSFKKKFGGTVKIYPQPVDVVYRPLLYFVFRIVKALQCLFR